MSEKRKKSWREIDRQKDRSAHRREEPAAGGRPRRSPVSQSRSHRAALDRLFDSGDIGEIVRKKEASQAAADATESAQGPSRRQLQQAIEKATDRDERISAMDAYLRAYSLVGDFALLGLMLEHPDPDVVHQAMDLLEELLKREKPRRAGVLRAALRQIEDLGEVAALRRRATELLERL